MMKLIVYEGFPSESNVFYPLKLIPYLSKQRCDVGLFNSASTLDVLNIM